MTIGESVLKITSLFVFFAYVSLRTHYNYLGISSMVIPDVNSYLAEFWQIFASTILILANLIAIVLIVGLPLYWISTKISRKPNIAWTFQYTPHLVLYLTIVWYSFLFLAFTDHWMRWDVLVGSIKTSHLVSGHQDAYYYAQVVFILMLLMFIDFGKRNPQWKRYSNIWNCLSVILVFLTINLPIWYGRFVKQPLYPEVQVTLKEENVCGFLIAETAEDMTVWSINKGHGLVIKIPKQQISQTRTGKVHNLFTVTAQQSAEGLNPLPCIHL